MQNFQGDFNKILLYKNSQVYSLEITKDNALIKPINIKGLSNVVSIDQNNKNKYVLTKKNEIALYDVQNLKIRKKIFSKTNIVFSKCVLNKSRILVFDDSFQIKIYDANSLVLLKKLQSAEYYTDEVPVHHLSKDYFGETRQIFKLIKNDSLLVTLKSGDIEFIDLNKLTFLKNRIGIHKEDPNLFFRNTYDNDVNDSYSFSKNYKSFSYHINFYTQEIFDLFSHKLVMHLNYNNYILYECHFFTNENFIGAYYRENKTSDNYCFGVWNLKTQKFKLIRNFQSIDELLEFNNYNYSFHIPGNFYFGDSGSEIYNFNGSDYLLFALNDGITFINLNDDVIEFHKDSTSYTPSYGLITSLISNKSKFCIIQTHYHKNYIVVKDYFKKVFEITDVYARGYAFNENDSLFAFTYDDKNNSKKFYLEVYETKTFKKIFSQILEYNFNTLYEIKFLNNNVIALYSSKEKNKLMYKINQLIKMQN